VFTGIVQELGTIDSREDTGNDTRLTIEVSDDLAGRVRIGDSVAINGVCLTVTEVRAPRLAFDVSAETLSTTRLGAFRDGAKLNIEPALLAGDPVGGHFVTGHVDGLGDVVSVEPDGRSHRLEVAAPESLERYLARKGCITVDGVSLTVNDVSGSRFTVNIVPHTWSATIVQLYEPGTRVHLEVDLIARYLERLMGGGARQPDEQNITRDYLSEQGFAPPMTDDDIAGAEEDESPTGPDHG